VYQKVFTKAGMPETMYYTASVFTTMKLRNIYVFYATRLELIQATFLMIDWGCFSLTRELMVQLLMKRQAEKGLTSLKQTMPRTDFTLPEYPLTKLCEASSYKTGQIVLQGWVSANLSHFFTHPPPTTWLLFGRKYWWIFRASDRPRTGR